MGYVDGTLRFCDPRTGKELQVLRGHQVPFVAIHPDGSRLATMGGDQSVKIWDRATGRELLVLHTRVYIWSAQRSLFFSPDGARLLLCDRYQGTTVSWDGTPWRRGDSR